MARGERAETPSNASYRLRSRVHGSHRTYFYGCSSYHLRGRRVCENCAEMPMDVANRAVLSSLREDLLQPDVARAAVQRAIGCLQPADDTDVKDLQAEADSIDRELARLTGAIAAGGELPALLAAVQWIEDMEKSDPAEGAVRGVNYYCGRRSNCRCTSDQ